MFSTLAAVTPRPTSLFALLIPPGFLIPFAIFGLIIVFVIVLLYLTARYERKRTEALVEVASGLNFAFFPKGNPMALTDLSGFNLFQLGHARTMTNLMQGEAQGLTISL